MNYYPAAIPAGYALAAPPDKPGLYAAAPSPYGALAPSPYATPGAQAGTGPGGTPGGTLTPMQHYAAAQQYAVVSQASPYSPHHHAAAATAAYYATPSPAGYAATLPLSSLQTIPTSSPHQPTAQAATAAYLGAYPAAAVGMQRAAVLSPGSMTAAGGYGGSPLYATATYTTGLPVPQPPSRPQYALASPMGYAAAAATANSLPPTVGSPAYPGATGYGPPY